MATATYTSTALIVRSLRIKAVAFLGMALEAVNGECGTEGEGWDAEDVACSRKLALNDFAAAKQAIRDANFLRA